MKGINLGDMLREVMEEKRREEAARDAAIEQIIRAGYSRSDVGQVLAHIEDLDGIASALAGCIRLVDKRQHEPSAKLAVELAVYLRESLVWTHNVLRRSGVDPCVFHLKNVSSGVERTNEIISRMNAFIREGQQTRELTENPAH